jgi:uncharacterized protein
MGENADVIRAAWEAFGRQDLDTAAGVIDESGEVVVPEGVPWGGTYRGPDGFKEMLGQFLGNLEDFRPSPQGFYESGDHVFVPLDLDGRTKTGNEVSGRALWMYELSGGKVRRAELFADTAETLEAIA